MKQGTYNKILGDATKPAALGTTPIVIPHVCNDLGLWGAGFVLAVTRAFGPAPETAYKAWVKNDGSYGSIKPSQLKVSGDGSPSLGNVQFVKIKEHKLVIANIIGQHGVGFDANGRPPIRYGALFSGMKAVRDVAKAAKAEIHCPMFGSDLAGGKWEAIEQMILEAWVDFGINVTVYEFPKK